MSEVATLPYTEKIKTAKKVNFTVNSRSPSGFSRDGGKTRIDVPKYKRILNEDRCMLSKDTVDYFNQVWGGDSAYLTISDTGEVFAPNKVYIGMIGSIAHKRYIKGQNIIWKAEQEKLGIRPSANDEIIMVWGDYNVDSSSRGTDKGLLSFLITHNQNEDYPLRDTSIAAASFKVNDSQRNAASDLEREDKVQEAKDIVYELRNTKTKRFDTDKMDFYTNVFRVQISGFDSDEEKFRALLSIAEQDPDIIIGGINKENVNYLQTIQQAIALQILVRGQGKLTNTQTNNTVVTFKAGVSEEAMIDKAVTYYASNDGKHEYEHLKNSVEAIKLSRVGQEA